MSADGDDPPRGIVIGSLDGEHIAIRTSGTAEDVGDGGWLVATASARVQGFTAYVEGSLLLGDLTAFRAQLHELNSTLRGEAELSATEAWLTLRLAGNGLGHIAATAELLAGPGLVSRLAFELSNIDQTHLPGLIRSLDAAIAVAAAPWGRRSPIRRRPGPRRR